MTGVPVASLRDASVLLGGRPVLRGVDLVVEAGEAVTLLGANGSGKSTLVRTLLGLVPLRRGSVELFGTPLAGFTSWQRIGFVPQRSTATGGVPASVQEVVTSGRLSHRSWWQLPRRTDRAAVTAALDAVGLADRADEPVATLSGGQHQRVLIARALAAEPELLVLDEPTAGVDLGRQDDFADIVSGLHRRGVTILLVAHELGPLSGLVSRTVVLRDGRVVYDGAPLASFQEASGADHHHHDDHHLGGRRDHVDYSPDLRTPLDQPGSGNRRRR